MRVHVELRQRIRGFIPRYAKQPGFRGELIFLKREEQAVERRLLRVAVEPEQGYPKVYPPCPELYDPVLTRILGDEIRFTGTAVFEDGIWRPQEWDIIILSDPYRKTFPPR